MWKFRPIGKYYELLVDGDSIYLCRKQDTIIQAVLEDLCNRHNQKAEAYRTYRQEYETGYGDGYRRGLADAIACEDKLT